jgi:hypothetical protein
MRLRSWIRSIAAMSCAALVATAACAEVTPEAQRVVDRYIAAAGSRAAFDTLKALRIDARVTALGLSGTSTIWAERPDRRASYTHLGPFEIPEGFDGTTGWRVDPSGKLLTLDGKDLEDARAAAWFENLMWLTPGAGGGSIRVAATDRDSAGRYTVLEITPPVGRPRRYWFNDRTGLIDREGMKHDQQNVSGTLTDYRSVGGQKFAFRSVDRIEGMPANDLTILVDSIAVNPTVDASRFRPPAPEANRITWLKTAGRAEAAFRYSARHVWVRASISGSEPADFLFDTGASITILDSTYAAKLGLATEGELQSQGAASTGSARFSQISTLRLDGEGGDGVEFSGQKVGVLSVNPFLEPFFWRGCAGVIGADFISRVVTEIDYDHGTLVFYDPATYQYAGKGAAVPFVLAGNMPAVKMTLDGRFAGDFRVDVGSSSTVDLHGPFVERNRLQSEPTGRRIPVVGGGFGGTFTSTLTRMKTLTIGPYSWQEPMLTFSGAASGALASEDYAGNIGNQILQRFKCTFDYERRMLYLEPSARYGERDRFSRSGVQLARYGDDVKAMQVIPNSPAYRAGLREGDQVAAIDGRTVLEWTPDALQHLFEDSAVGRVVEIERVRDGRKKTLKVKLADLL